MGKTTQSRQPEPAMAEAFARIATGRHSCRAFLRDRISRDRIRQMLSLAQRAPSDCNTQSWTTYVVGGFRLESLRTALFAHVAAGGVTSPDLPGVERYEGALLERRRACGWALYDAVGIMKGDREAAHRQALENFRFFGAPHLALITVEAAMGARGVFDAGIHAGHLLLAAEALEIAAVPQAAVTHYAGLIRQYVEIPASRLILCGVAFGIEDRTHPANTFRTPRADDADHSVWVDDEQARGAADDGGAHGI